MEFSPLGASRHSVAPVLLGGLNGCFHSLLHRCCRVCTGWLPAQYVDDAATARKDLAPAANACFVRKLPLTL